MDTPAASLKPFVAYFRVSTDKQGESGLGLEAQRATVARHHPTEGWVQVGEYVEVESGKRGDRPQLTLALARAKSMGATLVVAKLDRLSRSLSFVANLMESKVNFCACDVPQLNDPGQSRFLLGLMANIAEYEASMISARTKAALAAKKAQGAQFGSPTPKRGGAARAAQISAERAARDAVLLPVVREILAGGAVSVRELAAELNRRGIKPARGAAWGVGAAHALLLRARAAGG
jgi:DNA invertase Pin-like site-specific DNA recombinase